MNLSDAFRTLSVWEKGEPIFGYSAQEYRRDAFGNTIAYSEYGNRQSDLGWEIDHIVPKAVGGTDALNNLRPLHYRANASLGAFIGQALGQFR